MLGPRDLLLDEDNDIVVTTDLALSTGLTGVAQACRVAVQMFQEEWFLDLDVGIPYLQRILGRRASVAVVAARSAYQRELASISGVLSIPVLDVSFDGTSRTISATFQVNTAAGVTPPDSIALSAGGT